jgi:hypothetical protein
MAFFASPLFLGISAGLSAVAAGVSAFGMVQQGKAQEKQANAQAALERNNALQTAYDANFNKSVAEANEKEALMQGEAKRRSIVREGEQKTAGAAAQLSRQGLDVGSVSFEDVLDQVALESESQAAQASYEVALAGQGYRSEALGFKRRGARAFQIGQYQSAMTIAAGKNAKRSSYFQAAGTAISGLGNLAGGMYETGQALKDNGGKWIG